MVFRILDLDCWCGRGFDEADEALHQEESATEPTIPRRHGVEIGSCQWKMHLKRLRKKTTVPKMYMWELPPSACVREEDASTVRVWLYR